MDHRLLLNPPRQPGDRASDTKRLLFVTGNNDQHIRPADMLKLVMLAATNPDPSVFRSLARILRVSSSNVGMPRPLAHHIAHRREVSTLA
jgi:hypothetical protein